MQFYHIRNHRKHCEICKIHLPSRPKLGNLCAKCASYGAIWRRIQDNLKALEQHR